MPLAFSQSIRRFTSAITSGPMPSPGRSRSLWAAMIVSSSNIVMPALVAGMTTFLFAPGVLKRCCAIGKTTIATARLCKPAAACHNQLLPEFFVRSPDNPQTYAHPARMILILSLAPTIGLGLGRFAYALVLPDMRDSLQWSYSAAGFMNTINAAGYLAGALVAAKLIKRIGLSATVRWGTFG